MANRISLAPQQMGELFMDLAVTGVRYPTDGKGGHGAGAESLIHNAHPEIFPNGCNMIVTRVRFRAIDVAGTPDVVRITEEGGDGMFLDFSSPYFPTAIENGGFDEQPNIVFEGGFKAEIAVGTSGVTTVRIYYKLINKSGPPV